MNLQNHSNNGFHLLEIAEELFQKHKGNFTEALAQETIRINNNSIALLLNYHYFVAKAYRRIGEIYEEIGEIEKAIRNYELALENDPKVGVKKRLQVLDPENYFCKPKEKKVVLQIIYSLQNLVTYIGKGKSCPAGQAPRGTYYKDTHYDDFCIYIKNHYLGMDTLLGSASVAFTSNNGDFLGQKEFNHLIFKFDCSSYQGYTVSISFDLKLHLNFPNLQNHLVLDISSGVQRKDQLRCLFLSKDCKKIYYSNGSTLFILNNRLEVINKWSNNSVKTNLDSLIKYPLKALSILGLSGSPSNDEIKVAYRKQLLKVHPDINRYDTNANEKTREVINAYEILTNDRYRSENAAYHYNVFQVFIDFFPAFEDEIYSIHLSEYNNDIYIGYYSGNIVQLHDSGSHELYYRDDNAIREIKEIGNHLYFVSGKIGILKKLKTNKNN